MQKFYRYFTLSVLSLALVYAGYSFLPAPAGNTAEAQNNSVEKCAEQNVFVLEDTGVRTVHLAYDFERGKVHIVQVQKGYNPPVMTITTKNIVQ